MPPSITTPPNKIALSVNDIPLVVESPEEDYLATPAAYSVNYIEIPGLIHAGQTFNLIWTANQVLMTAAAVADESGTQFPAGDGSNDYVTSLLEYFKGNYQICRDYTLDTNFDGGPPRIIFTAKAQDTAYDFSIGSDGGVITPGATQQPVANFSHHIELPIVTGIYNTTAYVANVPPDQLGTGQSSLLINQELHAFLKSDYPVLADQWEQCVNSIGAYQVLYAQFKGDDPAIQKVRISDTFYVTKGGLGMQAQLIRDLVSELCPVDGDPTRNRFLRQGSKNKLVLPDQPEWLTFINLSADTLAFNLEVFVYNSDTTEKKFNAYTDPVSIGPYEKYQFQTGYKQLDIPGQQVPTKVPVYYTVRAKNGTSYVSDAYGYVLDFKFKQWPRFIIYENSLGAFQTIATVGKGQPEYDRTTDAAKLNASRSQAAITGEAVECNIVLQEKGTINIGYERSDARTTALLRDLLASEAAYLYDTGTLIPIGFNTKNLKDALDGTNVYANALEYFYKYDEFVYTEATGLADDSIADLTGIAGIPEPGAMPSGYNAIVDDDNDNSIYYTDI